MTDEPSNDTYGSEAAESNPHGAAKEASLGLLSVTFNDQPRSYRCEFRALLWDEDERTQEVRVWVEIPRLTEKHMDEIERVGLQKARAVINAVLAASCRSDEPAPDPASPHPTNE